LRVTRLLGEERTPRRVSELCESLVVTRLGCPRQGIFKFVGVGAVGDDDVHCAREAGELIGTGVGNDGYVQRGDTLVHGADVLENEAAFAAGESAGDFFNSDIAGGAFGSGGGEHLAFADGVEVAMELFVEEQAGDAGVVKVRGGLRSGFDVEGAFDGGGHGGSPGGGSRWKVAVGTRVVANKSAANAKKDLESMVRRV